ncbi:intradiol ring-cleavage dioxygenase [Ruania halotolerans]|uniref:intradiol ring-cleavage dioxygenase n=1 Tax=Ruania halotolerans TaxID=2897773 RepID=UPI001E4DE1EF|nr:intradiol ring-cleavage dioxygenase [Ruania halotolerans]UFU06825.1 intradiol ring-cleavage dioxygenase [Ruania halotolerans]
MTPFAQLTAFRNQTPGFASPPPARPTYQGRVLPHPEEELVDQGLGFDVVTVLTRRRMLSVLGSGAAGLGLAACSAGATSDASGTPDPSSTGASGLTEIPEETAGPYPGDGSNGPDVLEQSGIIRSDIRSSFGEASGVAEGVPMELDLTIVNLDDGEAPFDGVAVYVWHCTQGGAYSMYSEGITEENYLRGVQIADEEGLVSFSSIFPACYDGRWPHIHFEVYPDQASITDSTTAIATSQVALPQDVCDAVYAQSGYEASVDNLARVSLATDNVFSDDGGASQLATVTGDLSSGYVVSLTVGVDPTTEPAAAGGGGAPPEEGPAGGGEPSDGGQAGSGQAAGTGSGTGTGG